MMVVYVRGSKKRVVVVRFEFVLSLDPRSELCAVAPRGSKRADVLSLSRDINSSRAIEKYLHVSRTSTALVFRASGLVAACALA